MTKRRIAFVEPSWSPNAEDLWRLRANYKYPDLLNAISHDADVTICMNRCPPAGNPERRRLESLYGINFAETGLTEQAVLARPVASARRLAAVLAKFDAEIVSNMNGRKILHCVLIRDAAELVNAKWVWRIGGDDIGTDLIWRNGKNLPFDGTHLLWRSVTKEYELAETADTIIVMSPWEHDRMAACTLDPTKLKLCIRGIDLDRFSPLNSRAPAQHFQVLHVGRRDYGKGVDLVETAARHLHERIGDAAPQFVVASDFKTGREENRIYTGFIEPGRLPDLYNSADVFVFAGRSEGLPQVVVEAMASGLACVLSRPLFENYLTDGENAMLVEPTALAIANAVEDLSNDPRKLQRLAKGARTFACNNFDAQIHRVTYRAALLGEARPAAIS